MIVRHDTHTQNPAYYVGTTMGSLPGIDHGMAAFGQPSPRLRDVQGLCGDLTWPGANNQPI
jgi:hypothetical protein